MDLYGPLLEKTRVPQPSLQKFAVASIFSKFRSSPSYLDLESEPVRDAISQCLHSSSPAVVDQSVRELCRLVLESKLELSRGLLELQSALEGSNPKFVDLFVKGLGLLVRVGFQKNHGSWRFSHTENHPFVRILSSRSEAQSELLHQILLFMAQNRRLGMVEICEFLRPFFIFSLLRVPFSDSSSSWFARQLISSLASFCCSYPNEAIPIFKLLIGSLKHLPLTNSDEIRNSYYSLECMVDGYTVVLKQLAGTALLVAEAQLLGVDLSKNILSLVTCFHGCNVSVEPIVELVKRLLVMQRSLALKYIPELSSVMLSLFIVLVESELEHDQLCLLKLLTFLLKWKCENEYVVAETNYALNQELLFTFPVINLMSSASRSVKGAAADLLVMLEKLLVQLSTAPRIELATEWRNPHISSPGFLVYRLLQNLWFQEQSTFFISLSSGIKADVKGMHNDQETWASQLREYSLQIIGRRKSSQPLSHSEVTFCTEMAPFLSAVSGVLLMHPSLGNAATDLLAALGIMDPKQGVPLLLSVLFYSGIFTRKDINYHNNLPKLLAMLPPLASHFMMIPLVIQTILPMLQKDGKSVLFATGARLLCQTWAITDRAFGSLQAILLPSGFTEFKSDRTICISLAVSIRDVCKQNPDRGVDLILSVSACVESQDPIIQSLGFQSLAHLCEADVIDFYTAWDAISKHVLDYSIEPLLAQNLCLLLRWGAMDAEAYSEASRNVLQTLWGVATYKPASYREQWTKARVTAFEALTEYEVPHIQNRIPDFKRENTDIFLNEANVDVLGAMEGFEVKIITHEHMTRRRFIKEKKVAGNKIEKLLDVFPGVVFSLGKKRNAGKLPGAALFCLHFSPEDIKKQGQSSVSQDVHAGYENAMLDIAASLQLSRNIFVALLSLQSWKSFMGRWIRANVLCLDTKASAIASDKTTKAANDILKTILRLAEESIPRSAENLALAVGAFCKVLPQSAHAIKATASKFLLNWLFQHEHEHRQWSAALSLGLISRCLHATDHSLKFKIVTGLIEVLIGSKRMLVRGACGVGLGFSCEVLVGRVRAADSNHLEKASDNMQEVDLLGKIVRTLLLMTSPRTQPLYDILECLSAYFPQGSYISEMEMISQLLPADSDDLEEDIWGVAGLVFGLGSSIDALYRVGAHDAIVKIKDLIISWVPHVDFLLVDSSFPQEGLDKILSVGSCLVLPTIVAFCQRVEMMNDYQMDYLVNGYSELIYELVSVSKSGAFHQSLLMASCIGAGNLIACILNEGVHPIEVEHIKCLLDLFRKCYSNPYPYAIHLGGMLGVVNAMGAGAGILVHSHHLSSSMKTACEQKDSSYILGPLLSSHICEPYLTTLVQEIFLVAQKSDDLQMQQNATWALSFLRNLLWSGKLQIVENHAQTDVTDHKTFSHDFSEDSLVMKLSTWLMNLNYSVAGDISHVGTVVAVLRCLSQSPRLPAVNWGSIIRRCMKYEAQISEMLADPVVRGTLRVECLKFVITHANKFEALLTFLDELSDLSRFRTLELNLQSCLLIHLAGLLKIFSGSRLDKLLDDVSEFFSSDGSYQGYNSDQKSLLRMSCWKGLYHCLDEASFSSLEYMLKFEKCIQVLFHLLPVSDSAASMGLDLPNHAQEWFDAIKCLAKAKGEWLLNFLQVPVMDLAQGDSLPMEVLKRVLAKAKLVRVGSFSLTEIGRLKSYILNSNAHGTWSVLVEIVAALQRGERSFKSQWLVDAIEISCISSYPSTVYNYTITKHPDGCISKGVTIYLFTEEKYLFL
uniref:Protein RST1 isoform X1 n=1 Tax=Rhizophora mucronata TaxID=61149 RepID=A0A2P2K6W6_RHIMU